MPPLLPLPAPRLPPTVSRTKAGVSRSFGVTDQLRLARWRELMAGGMTEVQAFAEVATSADLGLGQLKGSLAVTPQTIGRKLERFLARVAPAALEAARDRCRAEIASYAGEMLHVLRDTARGAHDADPAAGRLRMEAATRMLDAAGVMPRGQGGAPRSAPGTAVQVNVGPSAHEVAALLASDPEAREAAITASRRVYDAPQAPQAASDAAP